MGIRNFEPLLEVAEKRDECHALIVAIFERAVRDALADHSKVTDRWSAIAWLRSKNKSWGSALWYAELADLDHLRLACLWALENRDKINYKEIIW